ncbi:MAG: hypothetical protein M3P44_15790, partial [Actinomycetota bacterium]|nr:hypothetical protein [Actinomycetota bacterium]
MRIWVVGALAVATAVVAGVVWVGARGDGSPKPPGEVVSAERGEVAVTVGGIGHVNTLTGAALLAVPASTATSSGAGTSSPAGGSPASGAGGSGGGGGSPAPADAVFPAATGHIARLLVRPGERVVAGQTIAVIADDGTIAGNVLQARSDLAAARLELAQKRVQDPVRGVPPTPAELASGREAVLAARAKLKRVLAPPLAADVAAARLDYSKAIADLVTVRAGGPQDIAAAQLAVATARQKLAALTGAPERADVTAAQLELAKATLDQETLLHPADAPSATALQAADLAIVAAQQKVAESEASSGTPAEVAAARADLAKAVSDRDALLRLAAPPTAAAMAAAQL